MPRKEPLQSTITSNQLETRFSLAFPREGNLDLYSRLSTEQMVVMTLLAEGGAGKRGRQIELEVEPDSVTISSPPFRKRK